MEESKCLIQDNPVDEVSKKSISKEKLVEAGWKHEFPEEMKKSRLMPTTKAYSEETHIQSPSSRGEF